MKCVRSMRFRCSNRSYVFGFLFFHSIGFYMVNRSCHCAISFFTYNCETNNFHELGPRDVFSDFLF